MTALFDSLATEVFQILKGSGRTLSLYDNHGNKVYDPSEARRMFAEPDKMMVGISEEGSNSAVQMSMSNNADLDDLVKIIDTLRNVSTRYNVLFNVRKYGKELSPKDFAFMAEPVTESSDGESIFESMWGSMKTSYQNIGSAKLIVRHSAPVREFVGARGRNINQLFVETRQGERFRFPVINLAGARAFAQHMNQGGAPHDSFSEAIVNMSRQVCELAAVSRHIHHNRNTLAEAAQQVRLTVREQVAQLKGTLNKIARERGYAQYMETFAPSSEHIQESNNTALLAEQDRLAQLLGIDTNHALAEALMPVALLTVGENTMASDNNTAFKRSRITFENAEAADHFMENMKSEFGYELVRESDHFVIDDFDVFENSQFFLDGADGVSITEEPTDKFAAYASKWTADRLKRAGEPTVGGDADKQSAALATGLKMLVAGRLEARPQAAHMPKFSDKNAEISFKLGLLLEPKAGLHNDALFNFLSQLADSLAHGTTLSANEQFFATRAAALVDKTMSKVESVDRLPEMQEMTEWFNSFDPNAVLEQDLSDDPSGLGDFQQRVAGELTQVDTSDHASMANGDDMDEGYHDIAHKVAAQLAYSDREYNRDHGDEQVEPTDWYAQIVDNWDAFTKLVDKQMGLAEGEIDEMDRFSGESPTAPDVPESKIWEIVDQCIDTAIGGSVPGDFDDSEDMAAFLMDKVWEQLNGWWDPTGDQADQDAHNYLHANSAKIDDLLRNAIADSGAFQENISQEAIQDAGTLELTDESTDEDDEEFDGTASLNALTAKLSKAVADKLGDHPEGVSAESCFGAVVHALSAEEIDILGGEAELLELIEHERDYRIKHGIVGYNEVDECDEDPTGADEDPTRPLPPAEDFVADVSAIEPKAAEDTAAGEAVVAADDDDGLARLRQLAGI